RNAQRHGRRAKAVVLRARDALFAFVLRRADTVCTIGSGGGDILPTMLRESYRIPSNRLVVLSQAIERTAIPDDEVTVSAEPLTVFYIGWVSPLRGVDTLLEAGRLLVAEGLDVKIRLGGWIKADGREL